MTALLSVYLAIVLCGSSAYLFYSLRDVLGYLFTSDPSIVHRCSQLAGVFSLLQFTHGVQGAAQGVMRGMNRQRELFGFTFFSYWLLGLPLGIITSLTYIIGCQQWFYFFRRNCYICLRFFVLYSPDVMNLCCRRLFDLLHAAEIWAVWALVRLLDGAGRAFPRAGGIRTANGLGAGGVANRTKYRVALER